MSDDYLTVFGPDTPRWLTYDRAASLLNVDQRTVRRAIERGEVRARKFARVVRIDAQSLSDYFAPVAGQ